jgi:uncharacterized protein YcaQ
MTSRVLPRVELEQARRMALDNQALGAHAQLVAGDASFVDRLVGLVEALGYLQRDPLGVVCPSHELVLWSRLGSYPRQALERALWQQRTLFDYWAHAAAIVPTRDFQLHRWRMGRYGRWRTPGERRHAEWIRANRPLRRAILDRLRREGPLSGSAFANRRAPRPEPTAWSAGEHQRLLDQLWLRGRLFVAGRGPRGRIWELAERWLPERLAEPNLSGRLALAALSERTLGALGVASTDQVGFHFWRGHGDLAASLELLAKQGRAQEVIVTGAEGELPGRWFASPAALERWERYRHEAWSGRTTLLSPFDSLIWDRKRTRRGGTTLGKRNGPAGPLCCHRSTT